MAHETARSEEGRRWTRARVGLIVAGPLLVIGGFAYAAISLGSVGTGDLDTVQMGEQITFVPAGSYTANVFTTGGERAPECAVTTADRRTVALGEAKPYMFNQRLQMESSYGFDLETDTTYLVTCGSPGEPGRFAVVEVPIIPEVVGVVLGSLGLLALGVGVVLLVVGRRRGRRERAA